MALPPPARVTRVGIPWYRLGDWRELRALFVDRDNYASDYADWERRQLATEQRFRSQGYEVVRVELRPAVFAAWCKAHGIQPDRDARSRFAAEGAIPPEHRDS